MSTLSSSCQSAVVAIGVAATLQLIRIAIDLISTATTHQDKKEKDLLDGTNNKAQNNEEESLIQDGSFYGSMELLKSEEEEELSSVIMEDHVENRGGAVSRSVDTARRDGGGGSLSVVLLVLHCAICLYLVVNAILIARLDEPRAVLLLDHGVHWTAAVVVALGIVLMIRDKGRVRFGSLQRFLYITSAFLSFLGCTVFVWKQPGTPTVRDTITCTLLLIYLVLVIVESCVYPQPITTLVNKEEGGTTSTTKKPTLSRGAILTMLKPYVWPDATANSAWLNRTLAILTWLCVILSKAFNLYSPILLGWASTALAQYDYMACVKYSIAYSATQFLSAAFKEGQSLVYLKVAQAAFVQLSEVTFSHIHSLSLDWHLRKKLGEVMRSMDRGIAACDTLMKYLFLWLVPAIAECLVVCIIFATYFDYLPLAVTTFFFTFAYIVWTVWVTLWRKKYRKAVVQSDNEWHDRATDSLINFETVKYFTAEQYEMKRFGESVQKYQSGSVAVQASLSFLNLSQRAILQTCLATSLSLAALGIQKRTKCCVEVHGCDSGTSQCCTDLSDVCTGMEVGDFVAVLTYTLNLFAPLNFLGSIYNAIVMAVVDLTNLSELLAQHPDVVDAPDAITLPPTNYQDPSIAVEFDNVWFHYPSQPSTKGLKGLSFVMKRGTTTAIVGSTGAGKTTVSRLLFRFYDVLGGAVRVNGVDVRAVTQRSLRGAMGVVPQSASMFNDTLRSNVMYGRRDATQEEVDKAAEDAQLTGFIQSLDDGWETMVGDRGLKLSGGEKQRTAIARCLLKDPPFVVLDEATSALDTITENSVQEALDSLGSERTVLVIAHRLGTIRNADNIVVLQDGQVAEQGTHDELMGRNGLYADMWNMQLHSTGSSGAASLNLLDQMLSKGK